MKTLSKKQKYVTINGKFAALSAFAVIAFGSGCSGGPSAESCEFVANQDVLGGFNALSMNSLQMELTEGTVSRQAAWTALVTQGFGSAQFEPELQALLEDEDGRDLVRYAATCALSQGQSVILDDGLVALQLHGRLGLAPEWSAAGLSVQGELEVSACLLAHVNALGRRVVISVRTPSVQTPEPEMESFLVHEGAFFGSIATQEFYSCYGDTPDVELYVMAPDRLDRVCTDGDDKCEIRALGACEDICEEFSQDLGWSACRAPTGEMFTQVSNVFLMDRELLSQCSE